MGTSESTGDAAAGVDGVGAAASGTTSSPAATAGIGVAGASSSAEMSSGGGGNNIAAGIDDDDDDDALVTGSHDVWPQLGHVKPAREPSSPMTTSTAAPRA
jgi:hypothetical protein